MLRMCPPELAQAFQPRYFRYAVVVKIYLFHFVQSLYRRRPVFIQ